MERLRLGELHRGVSPMIGVILMVGIVVVLVSGSAGLVFAYSDSFEGAESELDEGNVEGDNPWADDPLLGPENQTAGASDVRYRLYFEIQDTDAEGNSFNDLEIDVDTDDWEKLFNDTSQSEIETFEVQKIDGDEFDIQSDVDDWDIEDDNTTIDITLGGSAYNNPEVGDAVILIFDGVDNPEDPGSYEVEVEFNDDDEQDAELEIIEP